MLSILSMIYRKKNVIYRSYIDGFPVISARDFGTYQIQNRVRSKKLVFSQCSLQVPVPATGKAVTLKPTKEILPELQNADVDLSKDQRYSDRLYGLTKWHSFTGH